MIIECLTEGFLGSNSYIIASDGEGVVIDCGVPHEQIIEAANKVGIKIKYILLTHGHIDHIIYLDSLRKATGAQVLIHEEDKDMITNPMHNMGIFLGVEGIFKKADGIIKDGDIINVGKETIEVIHTPGHTRGGVCFKLFHNIFTGDTLFKTSIGRTDFEGGNMREILNSIKEKIMIFQDNTIIYPGHGEASTIGYEKKHNSWIL